MSPLEKIRFRGSGHSGDFLIGCELGPTHQSPTWNGAACLGRVRHWNPAPLWCHEWRLHKINWPQTPGHVVWAMIAVSLWEKTDGSLHLSHGHISTQQAAPPEGCLKIHWMESLASLCIRGSRSAHTHTTSSVVLHFKIIYILHCCNVSFFF